MDRENLHRKIEILAPAGSCDCFRAAVNAGADAVYAGGPRFGARHTRTTFQRKNSCARSGRLIFTDADFI